MYKYIYKVSVKYRSQLTYAWSVYYLHQTVHIGKELSLNVGTKHLVFQKYILVFAMLLFQMFICESVMILRFCSFILTFLVLSFCFGVSVPCWLFLLSHVCLQSIILTCSSCSLVTAVYTLDHSSKSTLCFAHQSVILFVTCFCSLVPYMLLVVFSFPFYMYLLLHQRFILLIKFLCL